MKSGSGGGFEPGNIRRVIDDSADVDLSNTVVLNRAIHEEGDFIAFPGVARYSFGLATIYAAGDTSNPGSRLWAKRTVADDAVNPILPRLGIVLERMAFSVHYPTLAPAATDALMVNVGRAVPLAAVDSNPASMPVGGLTDNPVRPMPANNRNVRWSYGGMSGEGRLPFESAIPMVSHFLGGGALYTCELNDANWYLPPGEGLTFQWNPPKEAGHVLHWGVNLQIRECESRPSLRGGWPLP